MPSSSGLDIYGRDGLRDVVASHERDSERRARAALTAGALTVSGWTLPFSGLSDLRRHLALVGLADGEELRLGERPADELDAVGQARRRAGSAGSASAGPGS